MRDDNPGNPFDAEEFDKAQLKWVRAGATRRRDALTASGAVSRHPSASAKAQALSAIREAKETLRRTPPFQVPAKERKTG